MRTLRLALAQINTTVGDLQGNGQKIIEYVDRAREAGADLVAFPELAVTGYPPEDLLLKPAFVADNRRVLDEIVAATEGIAAVIGFVDVDGDLFNAAAVAADGRLVGVYHKHYLPNYGVFDEERYFRRGTVAPVFVINGVRVGVNVCEDVWYPGGPLALQAAAGAEVIVNINGSPFHDGKRDYRYKMLATRAGDHSLLLAYLNLVGGQDELVFDGASAIFDPTGDLVAVAPAFEEALLLADLDVEAVFRTRLHDPRRRKEALPRPEEVPEIDVSFEPIRAERPPIAPVEAPQLDRLAQIYHALVLGTRDYVRKNGFRDVVVGLSGGIDSSLVAVIAVDALGAEHVQGVAMPSRFSSPASLRDAELLAHNLGIRLVTVPIEPAHAAYLEMLAPQFAGTQPGVAEENIQARIRGNILMALSNKFGSLVLTTGNKSEMAVGYATLYGDMAGGFAVIKDVFKTTVYQLAHWRNARAGRDLIPQSVLVKEPSAELRPGQRDVDALPPYAVLDPILRAYVEEDRSAAEIVARGFDPATVRRVIQMVDTSEYKRRQAPPGPKISPRAFGRDRRLPITNRYRDRVPEPAASTIEAG